MTNYFRRNAENAEKPQRTRRGFRIIGSASRFTLHVPRIVVLALLLIPLLYLLTLARTPVLGDPTEYTFIAHVLGIAHPPGYAFVTVVGKLFQTLVPFGDVAWRMHLLAAVAGMVAALFVYGAVRALVDRAGFPNLRGIVALFAGLTVATAVDHWQHAIHANPHIITATFTAANLYFLTKWYASGQGSKGAATRGRLERRSRGAEERGSRGDKWLYAFSLSAGLGVTHHPLTVFGFPAYAVFILSVWLKEGRPKTEDQRLKTNSQFLVSNLQSLLSHWPKVLKMLGFALLGLSLWLYYPLRSPHVPFGPTTMNTLNGFLDHVLARGLSESLPYFSLAEQPQRLLVFWSILRLQYSLPVIALALFGVFAPILNRQSPIANHQWPIVNLYALTFLSFYAFVISLRAQDIMAYLLGPLLIVGLLAGVGLAQLLALLQRFLGADRRPLWLLTAVFFLLGPVLQVARNAPRVSLAGYSEGADYIAATFDWFEGTGQQATLLNDWEHMTPLWYSQFVDGRWPDPADVTPSLVSAAKPWLAFVFDYLPGGPVYLSNYRRDVVDFGFRLRPVGPFYQVIDASDPARYQLPAHLTPLLATGEGVELVGYGLEETAAIAGDYVPLTLALRAPDGTADFYVPIVRVGDLTFTFTTDSHVTSPNWEPGEVIVERFDFALPHNLPGGDYPVTVDLKNLSTDQVVPLGADLGMLAVTAQHYPINTSHLLANFRQRVGLVEATARHEGRHAAPWPVPITAQQGDTIYLRLTWQALAKAEESYTVFVHLINLGNRPLVSLDYTPLGGSAPTHLWFPKWLPGQRYVDPYPLTIPADLPPGEYLIEVGLYEMVSQRRLHMSDAQGNLAGDRYILGSVIVGNP